jgi:hypothetical protein
LEKYKNDTFRECHQVWKLGKMIAKKCDLPSFKEDNTFFLPVEVMKTLDQHQKLERLFIENISSITNDWLKGMYQT